MKVSIELDCEDEGRWIAEALELLVSWPMARRGMRLSARPNAQELKWSPSGFSMVNGFLRLAFEKRLQSRDPEVSRNDRQRQRGKDGQAI